LNPDAVVLLDEFEKAHPEVSHAQGRHRERERWLEREGEREGERERGRERERGEGGGGGGGVVEFEKAHPEVSLLLFFVTLKPRVE